MKVALETAAQKAGKGMPPCTARSTPDAKPIVPYPVMTGIESDSALLNTEPDGFLPSALIVQ